jgi:hypothetical protein
MRLKRRASGLIIVQVKLAHTTDAATSKLPRQQFTLGSPNALSQLSLFMRTDGKKDLHKMKAGRV